MTCIGVQIDGGRSVSIRHAIGGVAATFVALVVEHMARLEAVCLGFGWHPDAFCRFHPADKER